MENLISFNFLNDFIVKRDFANIFKWCFFSLTGEGGLSILESLMSNNNRNHCVYSELLTSLRLFSKKNGEVRRIRKLF